MTSQWLCGLRGRQTIFEPHANVVKLCFKSKLGLVPMPSRRPRMQGGALGTVSGSCGLPPTGAKPRRAAAPAAGSAHGI